MAMMNTHLPGKGPALTPILAIEHGLSSKKYVFTTIVFGTQKQ
jgi:hypothetical protein